MRSDHEAQRESMGYRLRRARQAVALSAREVAREMQSAGFSLSHSTLCNYEREISKPPKDLLAALASLYGVSLAHIKRSAPAITGVRYRCLKSVRATDKRMYLEQAARWFDACFTAERVLGIALSSKHPNFAVHPSDSGNRIADQLRKELGLGINPVSSVVRVLEEFGIRVIHLETPARIDEVAGYIRGEPVVVTNPVLSSDRIRLNCAHALGHHFFSDCCPTNKAGSPETMEKRAFEFGSHFLMPERVLRKAFRLRSMVRLVQFKERYGLSLAAMIYRARRSSILPPSLYERLWIQFGQLGWRKREPGYVAPDRPVRMEELFETAVHQGKLNYGEIADIAGVTEQDLRRRVLLAMGGSPEHIHDSSRIISLEEHRRHGNTGGKSNE